jgi:hypothetical protein
LQGNASLGDLLKFMSLIMFAYTLFMAYEIVDETMKTKKATLVAEEEAADENL